MDAIQRLIDETNRNSFGLGNSYRVHITHINNPHSFYVRSIAYDQYMSTVQTRGDPMDKAEIKPGTIVIFKSKQLNDYVRGKIIFVESEEELTCGLHALDFGCLENCVPLDQIWKPYYSVNFPALAFHCQLGNCILRDEKWQESTIKAMKGFVKGEVATIKIKNILSEVFIVEVCICNPDDLSTLLAITRHTDREDDLDYQFSMFFIISKQSYPERILQVKSSMRVRLQSGILLHKFYVAQVDEYKTYLKNRDEYSSLAECKRGMRINEVKLNAIIGVFYCCTCKYERAIVRDIIPHKHQAKVELVDWGLRTTVPVELLRPLPEQFLSTPPIAIYSKLHGSQYSIMKRSQIIKLSHTQCGTEFTITIQQVGEGNFPTLVTVSDVNYLPASQKD